MNNDFLVGSLLILCIIIVVFFLIQEKIKIKKQGKLILKMNIGGSSLLIWSILLIFWLFYLINNILTEYSDIVREIILPLLWVFISLLSIILSYRGSEIREDGIYHQRLIFKWQFIKGYSWISDRELRLHTNLKFNRKIIIQEKLKAEINEVLKQHINEFTSNKESEN